MSSNPLGFPQWNAPFVDGQGYITQAWRQYLLNMTAFGGGVVGAPGGGVTVSDTPPTQTLALTAIASGKFLGNLTGATAIPTATDYTFLNLVDVDEDSYVGKAGYVAMVNPTEDALILAPNPAGAAWIPLVDGSEPPNFITDGAGHLILVAYP